MGQARMMAVRSCRAPCAIPIQAKDFLDFQKQFSDRFREWTHRSLG